MTTQRYKKFGELGRGFHAEFDAAYEQFWRRRNMEPPKPHWHKKEDPPKKVEMISKRNKKHNT